MAIGEKVSAIDLDWSGLADIPLRPANVCVVQAMPDGHVLSFGYAPPLLAPSASPQDVPVQVVARLVLSPRSVDSFITALQANILKRRELEQMERMQQQIDGEERSDA